MKDGAGVGEKADGANAGAEEGAPKVNAAGGALAVAAPNP